MNREDIKKELQDLPHEWLVAFAGRVTTQALPALLEKEKPNEPTFAYWEEEERQGHLFAVLRATVFPYASTAAASDSALSASVSALSARTALSAASAASAARTALSAARTALSAADSASASASAASAAAKVGINIAPELALLKKFSRSGQDISAYQQQPLYAQQDEKWQQQGQALVQVLQDYGADFDLWAAWFQDRMEGRPVDENFVAALVALPEELLAQKPAQIQAYLKSLGNTAGALNRVRVIFLGYGAAGKTSLIRALKGLEVLAGKEPMTPGIDISTWQVPNTEIIAHFWDFGGQVVAHATHQFFLRSRCLYVLLLDGRTEINANEQAEYWLEHVRAFGNKAPVILVGNKADLCPVNLDMARLKEKHKNVLDFYPLSCTQYRDEYKKKFQVFQEDLIQAIKKLGVHQIRFSEAHLAVLEELNRRSGSESFLQKTAWLNLCTDQGLAEQGELNQSWLLDLFDKLGVIIHFPKIHSLDSYILNPRWLTYGVYTLLYASKAQEKQGRLRKEEIIDILSQAKVFDNLGNVLSYPSEKAAIIIQAMEEFKLCFPCRHEPDMIVIPALLESDQPDHGFKKYGKEALAFEFDFTGFLPRHIMPYFIVGFHDEIKEEWVWQNGVVLQQQEGKAEALVQVDYHDRTLSLWLHGPKANEYFKIIYYEIKRILGRMPELRFNEWVIVPEESRLGDKPFFFRREEQIKADFQDLLALEESGVTKYTCKAGTFKLSKILHIMPEAARKKERRKKPPQGWIDKIVAWWRKSRYFRAARYIFGVIFGMNALAMLEVQSDLFVFKMGFQDQPLLNIMLVGLVAFLFWLDYKENRNDV